ncbi:MAG: hypothetical protein ACXQTD_01960, partial [Candidatus Syntropharchaeia archaeon]
MLEKLLSLIYEKKLFETIKRAGVKANHVLLVLNEEDLLHSRGLERLKYFAHWCFELGIKIVSIYVSVIDS